MATIYKTPKKQVNPATGKWETVCDADGNPIMLSKWRTVIFDHTGKRKMYTLGTHKAAAQKQADMLELREREIKNGIRPKPEAEAEAKPKKAAHPFEEVIGEYMAWGRTQGGRRGAPWDNEHADKKERELSFWHRALELKDIADAVDILPKVEKVCQTLFEAGNCGKTVSNRVQHLKSLFYWCKKRKYLNDNPLAELGKFDTAPTFVRRAMTLEEYDALMRSCADHRRLLYEVAACSGIRENELRQLEPRHLNQKLCSIRIERDVDKGRKERIQPIPAALMERLTDFVASGEARELYKRLYHNQGERPERKEPPRNPLLYVPSNPATALKKDLEAAGIPYETEEGRLDFHALRTAYINFLIDVGANPKTTQSLARHATLEMTMNVYGRAREDNRREAVEALGKMLAIGANAKAGQEAADHGQQNYQQSTNNFDVEKFLNEITLDEVEGYLKNNWCGREDLKLILSIFKDLQDSGQPAAIIGHFSIQPRNFQEVTNTNNVHEQSKTALPKTDAGRNSNITTTEHERDNVDACHPVAASVELQSDLLEVINMWQNLPDSMKTGILVLIKSALNSQFNR